MKTTSMNAGRLLFALTAVFGLSSATATSLDATLPDGYTSLEFVESTGVQALDTGVSPDSQTRVVCDCLFTTTNSPQRCGMVKGSALFMWGRESAYAGRYGSIVSMSWNDREDSGVAWDRRRHVFDLKSGSQKLDGVEYGTHAMTAASTQSLWLFGTHYDTQTAILYPCHMRLYSCQIYSGAELVRDYVPAQNEQGVVGLYDRQTETFIAPSTGSLFAKRRVVLPDGYMEIDAAVSTGSQWIDTGVMPSKQTRVICDCQFTATNCPQRCGSSDSSTVFFWGLESAYKHFGSIVSSTWDSREDTGLAPDTRRHEFDLKSGAQLFDGARYGTHTFDSTSTRSLHLFGADEGASYVSYPCQMRIFSCRIYDGQTLVRDYVPVRDPSGRVGLYDLANDAFTAPANGMLLSDTPPSLPTGYAAVDYVESDGTQYIDTGCKVSNQRRVICDCQFTKTGVAQRNGYNANGSVVFRGALSPRMAIASAPSSTRTGMDERIRVLPVTRIGMSSIFSPVPSGLTASATGRMPTTTMRRGRCGCSAPMTAT